MNVYDFDKTIYDGDSTLDFYIYCLRKKPVLIKYFPIQFHALLKYKLKKCTKLYFKEQFYSFLNGIDNVDRFVEEFWDKNQKKIKKWYIHSKNDSDVIISASPEFILNPICERLAIKNLIASKVNKINGQYESENCYGEEKVDRFREKFSNDTIDKFYSDSLSDYPLAKISKKSYIVSGENIVDWHAKNGKILSDFYLI